mgnify:CR=1 FL=1
MLKVTNKKGNISYILTEQEKQLLISEECKNFIKEKLNNINKYVQNKDEGICFFTDKPVVHCNEASSKDIQGWGFNVNKDGKLYNCLYALNIEYNKIEKEALYFMMWRYGDEKSYIEVIGDYIENGNIYSVRDTKYNECKEWLDDMAKGNHKDETAEKIELNKYNKEEIRQWFLA